MDKNEDADVEVPDAQLPNESIVPRMIEHEMKQSYLDYAMSVIVGRALPDVRDGLKPVHRRILYAMYDMGMLHNKPFKKSARIVGEVLGKYHPHGDMAVYDTLVRMVQDFSLRYPLINGQGNFGSIDGDNAAAMRYSEARLNKLSEEALEDIDKDTVKFQPNFDNSLEEPSVLPSKVPNLLLNGSSGIAVGMATNIPPHNMGEVVDGTVATIDNPEITPIELMQYVKGPDFPTGATICGANGIKDAYKNGRGKLKIRAKVTVEEKRIIIHEIPYMVNKSEMIIQIADSVRNKKIEGISDIRDESDKDGIRVIVELKKDANSEVVLNQLFKHSRLQVTFGVIMLALVDNQPQTLNLKQLITHFINHRKEVVRKRTQYDLDKASSKAHILAGLIKALGSLDLTINLIRKSESVDNAKSQLISQLELSEKQAQAILDMKLSRLTSLEQDKIKSEHKGLLELIEKLKAILADEKKILDIIKSELLELKEKYGDERRTEISEHESELIQDEDLIKHERMVITKTHSGYIKRIALASYKQQKRGGKGIVATGTKEEDFVEDIFIADTHSYILFFTNKGRVHWLKVYEVPESGRQAKGKAIINLLNLQSEEKITAYVLVDEFDDEHYLFLATQRGIVKKTSMSAYSNPRKGGIIAITLEEKDELIGVVKTDGNQQIMLATRNGMAVRFEEEKVRPMGRSAKGVKGATLKDKDSCIGLVVCSDEKTLLTITENGYGKRTSVSEYRLTNRGGVGVRNIICSDRNGKVVSVKSVSEEDQLMFISRNGIVIRTSVKGISTIGRATQGMTLMKLNEGDNVVAAAKIVSEKEEEEACKKSEPSDSEKKEESID